MDSYELANLAEKEIRLGVYDRPLMERAVTEAKGVTALAHQIYWRLRSQALVEEAGRLSPSDPKSHLSKINAQIVAEEKRARVRESRIAWIWVLVCIVSLAGAGGFLWYPTRGSAYRHPRCVVYSALGAAFLILGAVSFIKLKSISVSERGLR